MRSSSMYDATECLMKAENYAVAARMATELSKRCALLRLSAIWRNRALRMRMSAVHAN
jgi:hypothetical protein